MLGRASQLRVRRRRQDAVDKRRERLQEHVRDGRHGRLPACGRERRFAAFGWIAARKSRGCALQAEEQDGEDGSYFLLWRLPRRCDVGACEGDPCRREG